MSLLTKKIDKLVFEQWGQIITQKQFNKAWGLLQEANSELKKNRQNKKQNQKVKEQMK